MPTVCKDLHSQMLLIVRNLYLTVTFQFLFLVVGSEAGGRIFYPCQASSETDNTFTPVAFDGATQNDLIPFGITEDLNGVVEWKSPLLLEQRDFQMTKALGSEPAVPVAKRSGLLWEYARTLQSKGYVLDTNGYSTCFRVNRKQQTTISDEEFDALLNGQVDVLQNLARVPI